MVVALLISSWSKSLEAPEKSLQSHGIFPQLSTANPARPEICALPPRALACHRHRWTRTSTWRCAGAGQLRCAAMLPCYPLDGIYPLVNYGKLTCWPWKWPTKIVVSLVFQTQQLPGSNRTNFRESQGRKKTRRIQQCLKRGHDELMSCIVLGNLKYKLQHVQYSHVVTTLAYVPGQSWFQIMEVITTCTQHHSKMTGNQQEPLGGASHLNGFYPQYPPMISGISMNIPTYGMTVTHGLHMDHIYIYIYMSRDPHTPPTQPDGSPPLWQGRGGFLSSQAMVYVVFIVHIMHMYR